ncbi:alpha-amylase [archaeon]|nr:alpha-amylase [archaeon]
MVSVCFYFQVHQPFRIRDYSIFDIGNSRCYFKGSKDKLDNEAVLRKVADKCYLPANKLLLDLIKKHPGLKVSFSISGVALEQFQLYYPEVIESFKELVKTGSVELLSETYHHSLAFLHSLREFKRQVSLHKKKVKKLFNVTPRVFRNTELIYNNDLARVVEGMGYEGVLAEGADQALSWRSPNFVYKSPSGMRVLLKNYRLSDDIAFRFSERSWSEWPLTAPKFAQWVSSVNGNGQVVNLFMDYETMGEHQWASTGIFDFLRALPRELFKHPDNDFKTPSEVIKSYEPVGVFDSPGIISWADIERDISAWQSNKMQRAALKEVYKLEPLVLKSKNKKLISDWRKLQTSDHFYYMCTKWFADGDVHKYFNPYESPYDAFINYMNVLRDIKSRVSELIL